jgi:16S rRNA pseudouridine516 synthase
MRLDKFLSVTKTATRTEAAKACRRGEVTVNGEAVRDPSTRVDEERDVITYMGAVIPFRRFIYVMMNKPAGVVSATEDARGDRTVIDILPPEFAKYDLFPCGRLDRDTTGLLILTNDGIAAHRLLAPKRGVEKTYRFTCALPLTDGDCDRLRAGVDIGGHVTAPARLEPDENRRGGLLMLTEGKYHEVKRMLGAVGNRCLTLERVAFGPLRLDASLAPGDARELTAAETEALLAAAT